MIKTILLAYDFSKSSQQALKRSIQLCLKYKASLFILHVVEENFQSHLTSLLPIENLSFQLKEKIQEDLKLLVTDSEINAEILIGIGNPAIEILRNIEMQKPDLVILGSQGHSPIRTFLGKVAEKVIQRSPVPVLIHRETSSLLPQKILLPVDFSESCSKILEQGLQWTKDFSAQLHLLHIIDLHDLYSYDRLSVSIDRASIEATLRQEAQSKLSSFSKKIPFPHVKEIRLGNPAFEIEAYIKEQQIDLVVLATHGRTGVKHFLMGSIAEQITRTSSCSVITINGL